MGHRTFRIILTPEEEGGYTVTVPTLPGCVTYGGNIEEAKKMAREAIEAYIEDKIAHNEQVVDDSDTLELSLSFA